MVIEYPILSQAAGAYHSSPIETGLLTVHQGVETSLNAAITTRTLSSTTLLTKETVCCQSPLAVYT